MVASALLDIVVCWILEVGYFRLIPSGKDRRSVLSYRAVLLVFAVLAHVKIPPHTT